MFMAVVGVDEGRSPVYTVFIHDIIKQFIQIVKLKKTIYKIVSECQCLHKYGNVKAGIKKYEKVSRHCYAPVHRFGTVTTCHHSHADPLFSLLN